MVSDDIDWCKTHFGNLTDVYFVGTPNNKITKKDSTDFLRYGDDIGNDMALLAQADHSILSLSTYGLWGALLAGGDAVLPEKFKKTNVGKSVVKAKLPGWVFI